MTDQNQITELPEVIERIAKAICVAFGDEWEDLVESGVGMTTSFNPAREDFREMARAAVEAYWECRKEQLG